MNSYIRQSQPKEKTGLQWLKLFWAPLMLKSQGNENEGNNKVFLLPSMSVSPWTSPPLKQGNNTREFLIQGKQGLKEPKEEARSRIPAGCEMCPLIFMLKKKKKKRSNKRGNGCLGKAECYCSLLPSVLWCNASVLSLLRGGNEIWWYPAGWLEQLFSLKIKLQEKICIMGKWKQ